MTQFHLGVFRNSRQAIDSLDRSEILYLKAGSFRVVEKNENASPIFYFG
jgi:hypothetical protein